MCLYPKLIRNRKYTKTKKNGGNIPEMKDQRVQFVPVGCQKCIECRKQKGREWSLRLQEEIRTDKTGKFVTLTFSNEAIHELEQAVTEQIGQITGYDLDNEIATLAIRRYLERWRKKHKKSVKHWFITELGQGKNWKWQGTENLHLHGIMFTNETEDIKEIWKYGFVFIGKYVTEKTVNYMAKYMTKVDQLHREYTPKILTSAGMGSAYTTRADAQTNKYNNGSTDETYTTRQGNKMSLPVYWRNKIYTEEQREKLWLQKLDKQERWVDKQRIDVSKGEEAYNNILKIAQEKNERLGYGNDKKNWDRQNYELMRRELKQKQRIQAFEVKRTKG
ncbi:MAG: replication initiator protein [Microviridae sp.]|nr:MAG: replication initiator protein [Microviridae sp.]